MAEKKYSLVFMGTPKFAVPALAALVQSDTFGVSAVVTAPDKPAGRGQKLKPSPVKEVAQALGLSLFQPRTLRHIVREIEEPGGQFSFRGYKSSASFADFLSSAEPPDALVAVAFGQLIPAALLSLRPTGVVNVHPSLLPRWRGAAPIQRCIFEGDARTGVTLMRIDEGLDTGPIYCFEEVEISDDDESGSLSDKLSTLGARLLLEKLGAIIEGDLEPVAQGESSTPYAEKWEKGDCRIRWDESANVTIRRIRASCPQPGAWTYLDGETVKIFRAVETPNRCYDQSPPGTIVDVTRSDLVVSTGCSDYISIREMQFPGKRRLTVEELLRGRRLEVGSRFS